MSGLFNSYSTDWFSRRRLAGLAILLLVAAGLRLYGLDRESLWLDEACSWHTATHPTLHAVAYEDVGWHMHPPGYFVFLHYWIAVFGDSEMSLRMPSAIVGVVSVFLMYLLGCRWYGPREGMLSAALTACLLYPVWYSQEARPYGILLLLTLCSTLPWMTLVESASARAKLPARSIIAYTLAATLTCYWHYFGLMFVALQGGALVLIALHNVRTLLTASSIYVVVVAAYIPWWPSFWAQLNNDAVGHPTPQNGLITTMAQWMGAYFNYRSPHFGWITVLGSTILAVLVLTGAIAVVRMLRDDSVNTRTWILRSAILVGWLLIPFAFAYGKSVTSSSIYTQRNLIVSAPIIYLAIAHAVALIPQRRYLYAAAFSVICAAALIRTVYASGYYVLPFKDQYRQASVQMLTDAQSIPGAIFAGTGYNRSAFDYYLKRLDQGRTLDLWGGKDGDVERYVETLEREGAGYMFYGVAEPGPEPLFERYLTEQLNVVKFYEFRNVSVLLLERPRR